MKKGALTVLILIFISIASSSFVFAVGLGSLLSPGELSNAHKKYEGIKNCTLCHKIGRGVLDSSCLDCHEKLAKRIEKNEGGHSKYTDICITCHIEHMGRDHKLVSMDEEKFVHKITGYDLAGKHVELLCSKCHRRQGVYGGLVRECISCHKDEHKKQLGRKCDKCHDPSGWEGARGFSHNRDSDYKVIGAHLDVKCAKCHVKGRFKPIKSDTCGSARCHGDQHKGQFKGKQCEECHDSSGYSSWKVSKKKFDHDSASFALKGAHLKVECAKCHVKGHFKPINSNTCGTALCHGDRHKGQFKGKQCKDCHKGDFSDWKVSKKFDHGEADFKLTGKHLKVDCKKCHVKGRFKQLEFDSCGTDNCHGDRHKGQFEGKACKECHNEDFTTWEVFAKFSHDKDSVFALKGRHFDLECKKCHVKGRFKPIEHKGCGTKQCHGSEHGKAFGSKECTRCHDPGAARFEVKGIMDHGRETGFPLEDGHSAQFVECKDCHSPGKPWGIDKSCFTCHKEDDAHDKTLGEKCEKCHLPMDWIELDFDHNKDTDFFLVTDHQGVDCDDCHLSKRYGDVPRDCAGCHRM